MGDAATYDGGVATDPLHASEGIVRSRLKVPPWPSVTDLGLVAGFAAAWLTFVFEGDQTAYAVAAGCVAVLAAHLCATGSPYGVVVVVAVATVVGTEARGELGRGAALLGSTRILDIALLFALLGVLVRYALTRNLPGLLRRRPTGLGILVLALCGWAALLWVLAGAPRGPSLNTDVRLLGLAVGAYVVTAALPRQEMLTVAKALLLLSPLLLVKAVLIFGSDLYAIGSNDRVQASLLKLAGDRRVVLVGGDTLLALGPALWAVLRTQFGVVGQRVAGAAAVCAAVGVLMSGTRTTVVVAIALWIGTEVAMAVARGWRPTRRAAAIAGAGALVLVLAAAGFGVIERFQQGDTPHTGLNFRLDEIRNVTKLPPGDFLVGQGLGGTFISKNVNGETVRTAWSHVLPVWLVLKIGALGALAAAGLFALFLRRAITVISGTPSAVPKTGLVTVLGLVGMSLALGRIALPEGATLLGLAAAFVVAPGRSGNQA